MSIAAAVLRHLKNNPVVYREITHVPCARLHQAADACGLAPGEVAQVLMLKDGVGALLMAILPLEATLDIGKLQTWLRRDLRVVSGVEVDNQFPDCTPGCHPPFGELYGLSLVVDESLLGWPQVYFGSGSPSTLLCCSGRDFLFLLGRAPRGDFIVRAAPATASRPPAPVPTPAPAYQPPSESEIRKRLEEVYRLPAMPAVATQVLQLVSDPSCTAKDLADLVEKDPSIAAQVIRYARSSFFGYRGTVDSIATAITRVLGFDIVSNLALGIAAGRVFRLPAEGALGLNTFWRHGVYAASLSQALARTLPERLGVKAGTAYLAGLLHNFGVLLLGHMFAEEYAQLNARLAEQPDLALPDAERQLFGEGLAQKGLSLGHNALGGYLMRHWNMPGEIIMVTEHHHDAEFLGEHEAYVHLIRIVNALLARHGIGDDKHASVQPAWLAALSLTPESVERVFTQLMADGEALDGLAQQMVA